MCDILILAHMWFTPGFAFKTGCDKRVHMMQRKTYTLILHKKAPIVTKEGLSLVQHSTLGRILVSKKAKQPKNTRMKERNKLNLYKEDLAKTLRYLSHQRV